LCTFHPLFLLFLLVSLCEVIELVVFFSTAQVHQKQNSYAFSIAFLSLNVFTGSKIGDVEFLKLCKNIL
jgi:hypothetical protein